MFSGAIITESMFNLHGMGKFFITALTNQDWNLALAIQMFYIVITLISYLAMDIAYAFVDPRVKIDS